MEFNLTSFTNKAISYFGYHCQKLSQTDFVVYQLCDQGVPFPSKLKPLNRAFVVTVLFLHQSMQLWLNKRCKIVYGHYSNLI